MLQPGVIRLELLLPASQRNKRCVEARRASFLTGQFAVDVADVERLFVVDDLRDLADVIVRACRSDGRRRVVAIDRRSVWPELIRQREEIDEGDANRIEQVLRDDVAGERLALTWALIWVENLHATRAEEPSHFRVGQQLAEIALPHLQTGHAERDILLLVNAVAAVVDEKVRAVAAAVQARPAFAEARQVKGPADGEAILLLPILWTRLPDDPVEVGSGVEGLVAQE